jgi:hypothetical protein
MADDRRVNMYFSENKYIDDTIYQYFKDMPNKQDTMKMVLYKYVTERDINSNNFVTKNTQKSEEVVTKTTPKKHKKITKKTQEEPKNVTKDVPVDEEIVTKDTQKEHKKETNFNFDDLITEEEIENKDSNESGFDLNSIMDSMNQFMK